MKRLMNSEQMRAIDSYSIEELGIPAMVLMENAANQFVKVMEEEISKENRILAVCGSGNNGGDGLAIARILAHHGYQVDVFFAGNRKKLSKEAAQQLHITERMDMVIWDSLDEIDLRKYTVIVDALLGIGLDREVTGRYADIVEKINEQAAKVYSVDIASGIHADNGKVLGKAIKADATITFGYEKVGQLLYPGSSHTGHLRLVDIGFPSRAVEKVPTCWTTYQEEDLRRIPLRNAHSHKGTYGRVLVIAGSENMSGAAYLSAKAAYRTGAGLVEILSTQENRAILQTQLPEAILTTYNPELLDERSEKEKIKTAVARATAVVIGPGIGTTESSHKLLDIATLHLEAPTVFDADAINVTAQYYNTFPLMVRNPYVRLTEFAHSLPPKTIITPHLKELSRLMDVSLKDVQENLIDAANQCTTDSELIYAIKDARSLVCYREERYINTSGNSGMATAGSGDVLTGILAGLLAQGMEPYEAAKTGVFLHGLAGDAAAAKYSEYGMIASDIIDCLGVVLQRI